MSLLRPLLTPGTGNTLAQALAADPVVAQRCAVRGDGVVILDPPPGRKAAAELVLHIRERAQAEGLTPPEVRLAR